MKTRKKPTVTDEYRMKCSEGARHQHRLRREKEYLFWSKTEYWKEAVEIYRMNPLISWSRLSTTLWKRGFNRLDRAPATVLLRTVKHSH